MSPFITRMWSFNTMESGAAVWRARPGVPRRGRSLQSSLVRAPQESQKSGIGRAGYFDFC